MKKEVCCYICKVFLFAVASFFLASSFVAAHAENNAPSSWTDPVFYLKLTALWVCLLTLIVIFYQKKIAGKKALFFFFMTIPLVLATAYLGGHTIYDNVHSATGGPVHWHADYRIFMCGEKVDLVDPRGLSNKIGTPIFHEHNDDRIHIEGTVDQFGDYTLGRYFTTIGGLLAADALIFPTPEGIRAYRNGQRCPDDSIGTLKVYVNGKRVADPAAHFLYPDAYVPPGDCIIMLFDASTADTTSLLCESWEVQGWNYDSFTRRTVTIGGKTWQ